MKLATEAFHNFHSPSARISLGKQGLGYFCGEKFGENRISLCMCVCVCVCSIQEESHERRSLNLPAIERTYYRFINGAKIRTEARRCGIGSGAESFPFAPLEWE